MDIHFELELNRKTSKFPNEAALVRFLNGLEETWGPSDEVRMVRTSDGVCQARWLINYFLS